MSILVANVQLPIVGPTTNPFLAKDALTKDDFNGGTRFIWDMGDALGYPSQANPTNNVVVNDLSSRQNGAVVVSSGQAPTFGGGGIDLSAMTASGTGTGIQLPTSVAADIWGAVNGVSQQFLACLYVKLPTLANWNSRGVLSSMLSWGNYTTGADLALIAQAATSSTISFRRQIASGTVDTTSMIITPQSADYGGMAQIAFWRNGIGQFARMRTANGITWSNLNAAGAPLAVGAQNTQDFSGKQAIAGVANFSDFTGTPNGFNGLRHYRGFVSNLARDGRDPVMVLDADYVRTVARNVYS